jgi:hypothetical protein
MKLYRFSPIENKEQMMEAIRHIHFSCFKLCKQSFGTYFEVPGFIGIFCHYDHEFEFLIKTRKELTDLNNSYNQKYFKLYEPIVIPANADVPETTYTRLYIRPPDPYRAQVGDIDFEVDPEKYSQFKKSAIEGKIKGARIFPRSDLDMLELYDPDIDALGYVISK